MADAQIAQMKTCTKCGVEKPFEAFAAAKDGKHGRRAQCRECRSRYWASYAEKNSDGLRQKQAVRRRADPDAHSRKRAAEYLRRREACLEYVRAWREKNKARRNQSERERAAFSPERRLRKSHQLCGTAFAARCRREARIGCVFSLVVHSDRTAPAP